MDVFYDSLQYSIAQFGLEKYGLTPNIMIALSLSTVVVAIIFALIALKIARLSQQINEATSSLSEDDDQRKSQYTCQIKIIDLSEKTMMKTKEMMDFATKSEDNTNIKQQTFWAIGANQSKISILTKVDKEFDVKTMKQATVEGVRKDRGHEMESRMRGEKLKYYGNEAIDNRSTVTLNYPLRKHFDQYITSSRLSYPFIERSNTYVKDVLPYCDEFLEKFVEKSIRTKTGGEKLLFCALPFYLYQDKQVKEQLVKHAFERWDYDRVYLGLEHVLPIFSVGKVSGLSVDVGDLFTTTLPVYEGYGIRHAMDAFPVAGLTIENILEHLLVINECTEGTNLKFVSSSEREILRSIKEKLCYVKSRRVTDHDLQLTYNLPDGNTLRIKEGTEDLLFQPTEFLFNTGFDKTMYDPWCGRSLQSSVVQSLVNACKELRELCLDNVVLSGGTTMFDGFLERFGEELEQALNESPLSGKSSTPMVLSSSSAGRRKKNSAKTETIVLKDVTIRARLNRQEAVTVGANMLLSLNTINQLSVSREEFEDLGESVVALRYFSF